MEFWIAAGVAAYLLGVSKGGVPMIAMLSVPILALYMDAAMAAGLLLPLYLVADAYAIYLFRKAFSRRNLAVLLPAAMLGILTGYLAVSHVPGDAVKLLVAGIGISYLFNALRLRLSKGAVPPRPADVPRGLFWGALAGLTSYISHAGGPPFQAYVLPQRLEKMTFLGTTTIFFAVVNLAKVPPFVMAGQITWESVQQVAWLVPLALLGAWSGATVSRLLPERVFFVMIEVALGLVSLKLIYEVVMG